LLSYLPKQGGAGHLRPLNPVAPHLSLCDPFEHFTACCRPPPVLSPNEPSQMSWNLLERFIESEHFNQDPSLAVAYLA
jgi:hypothetical protein